MTRMLNEIQSVTFQKVIDGKLTNVTVDVEISIDVSKLARGLGQKAFGNKTKRSKEIDGLVVVAIAGKPTYVQSEFLGA